MANPIVVYLADLRHEGHNVKTFPYGIGCLAAYALRELGDRVEVKLFHEYSELADAILAAPPHVLGLSNYIWNLYLSTDLLERAKAKVPGMVTVMGGPNFPEDGEGRMQFMAKRPLLDFYVQREGEVAFVSLLSALIDNNLDVDKVKAGEPPLGAVFMRDGHLIEAELPVKVKDLDTLPSPYLSGLMDKFIDAKLDPLMQFKRGCPFKCTFCGEGVPYYARVGKFSIDHMMAELNYLAERIDYDPTVYLADANFGMYADDVELCRSIADLQDRTGWPTKISSATGKNHIERVFSATALLRGAMRIGAAVQSTSADVLDSIKRTNISVDKLVETANRVRELGQNSYSEIILGLPDETLGSHLDTIRSMVDAKIGRQQMYPLTILPGTEMDTREYRDRYGLVTKFRILPRCFGGYRFGDSVTPLAEVVENPVSSNSMSFDDYVFCKTFHMSVELFFNDHYFAELFPIIEKYDLSIFGFVQACHDLRAEFPADLANLYNKLEKATRGEFWETREECETFARDHDRLTAYAENEYANSLATNRAIALLSSSDSIHAVAEKALLNFLEDNGVLNDRGRIYVSEAIRFSRNRKSNLLDASFTPEGEFHFDFSAIEARHFEVDPFDYYSEAPLTISFRHTPDQTAMLKRRFEQYDNHAVRLRNIIYHATTTTIQDYYRATQLA